MATSTPHLGLHKPAGEEVINVDQDLNANWDKIDNFSSIVDSGWTFIGSGSSASQNFVIDITNGGVFPAGTFDLIKLYLSGQESSGAGSVNIRLNEDATAGFHERSKIVFSSTDGSVSTNLSNDGGSWAGPDWGTGQGNTAEFTLFKTGGTNNVSMIGEGSKRGGDREYSLFSGDLSGTILLDRIEVRHGPTPTITNWHVEGFRDR